MLLPSRRFAPALALALASVLGLAVRSRADEPLKPTASASETNPAAPAAGHSLHGEAFNDGPRRAAHILPGMGKCQFPATTKKPEAQAFINQGVAQLHTFYYFESERSFRQAATIDPDCAIAYWGMAMSNPNNAKRARGFLKDARERIGSASRRERLYIEALEALYKDGTDDAGRQRGWLGGLETIVQEFPDDLNARAWTAMVAWQNIKGGVVSRQSIDALIEPVLRAEPMHPGAHHYRIHLWDDAKPAMALKSSALYGPAAPGIAHAWHMPGHIYTRLQRYADAAYQQEASARVDHAYMMRDRVMPFEIHNYAHNNQWLCTTYSHLGRVRDAVAVARNLVEQPRDPQKNGPKDGGSPQRSGRARWAEALTRYELWDDLIAAASSGALDWSDVPQEQLEKAHALGLAYAARHDRAGLSAQIAALGKIKPPAAKSKPLTGAIQSAIAELEGHRSLAAGDIGAAFEQFRKADKMRPEALARAHLQARNYGLAESAARKAVNAGKNQVAPLAVLVEALHAAGKEKDAQKAYRELAPIARWADRDLPALRRISAIVDEWKADKGWSASAATSAKGEDTDDAAINRVDLETLGPLVWSPFPAINFEANDTNGKPWKLAEHRGKNVLVIFFLGRKCAHCLQQLQVFGKRYEALKKLNVETVAIDTDDAETTRALKNNQDDVKFPMPMLADPGLAIFQRYQAYDDFEKQPLHGTFLIDARGDVRFQRISADPFLEVEFIEAEAARINRLLKAEAKAPASP